MFLCIVANCNRNELPEMMASIEPIVSGFCLTEPIDSRYAYISSLKHRFGEFLHKASVSLRLQGEENTLDAVKMLASQTEVLTCSCSHNILPDQGNPNIYA
jgi:hypothetical protein